MPPTVMNTHAARGACVVTRLVIDWMVAARLTLPFPARSEPSAPWAGATRSESVPPPRRRADLQKYHDHSPVERGRGQPGALLSRKTWHMLISAYAGPVARSSTTSDVFNAIGDVHRREILDALIAGEMTVGAIVNDLSMSQPQVSKHLRVLSEVGLVRCRAEGPRRRYRLEPEHLRPLREWVVKYEQAWNDRMDRLDDYLQELQQQGELQ